MGFETVASGLLAAMISDEIGQEFGLGRGLELALSFAGSQETLPIRPHIKKERLNIKISSTEREDANPKRINWPTGISFFAFQTTMAAVHPSQKYK